MVDRLIYDEGVKSTRVDVDDSAAVPLPAVAKANRIGLLIQNRGPGAIWIGDEDVTAGDEGTGIEVIAYDAWNDDHIGPNCAIYAVCDTGDTADVRVMELS